MGFDYQELVKATESFSQSTLIGKGSHGSVYKAVLRDDDRDNRDHHPFDVVAIKRASCNGHEVFHENSKKLSNEIRVLSSLRHQNNPYVINFLGISHDDNYPGSDKLLVMEFLRNGSLYDLLHSSTSPPSWPKRVEIAIQIAKAIQFLHEEANPVVVHRDIKSSNILFDSNWNAKLVDFGLAVDDSLSSETIQPAGTIGYLDPCYTIPSKLSTKTDIYSFGVVLLEIMSCRKAIDVSKQPASIVDWATTLIKEKRLMGILDTRVALPTYIEGTIRHMVRLAARCVSLEEQNRPEIAEMFMVEMSSPCFVERVRAIPIWMSFMMRLKRSRQRKSIKYDQESKNHNNISSDISRGKMILREILADIALK